MKGGSSWSFSPNEVENLKLDSREVKLKLEKLNDEVPLKANIKDVCTLVDMKANIEEVDKSLGDIY